MGFGGSVWHASIRTFSGDRALAREMAIATLAGVGDPQAGEWHQVGEMAHHLRRRLTQDELRLAGGITVRDIRGTQEERRRFALLFADVPHLKAVLQARGLYSGS